MAKKNGKARAATRTTVVSRESKAMGGGKKGTGYTAVLRDKDGNIIKRRSGNLEKSSVNEAFKKGGVVDMNKLKASNKKRRETQRGY